MKQNLILMLLFLMVYQIGNNEKFELNVKFFNCTNSFDYCNNHSNRVSNSNNTGNN